MSMTTQFYWTHFCIHLASLAPLLLGFAHTCPVVNMLFMLVAHHPPSLTALLVSHWDPCLVPFCYTSPISNIASSHSVHLQQYTDDTQIFMALTTHGLDTQLHEHTSGLSALHAWFARNGHALNGNKSEAILFGTHENSYMPSQSVSIPDSRVPLSQNTTVLGVTLDSTLSLNKHYFPQLSVSVFLHECIKTHSFHTNWRYSNSSRGYTCSVTSGLCKLYSV